MQPQAENPCNWRLSVLLHAGYTLRLSDSPKDTLDLRHPSRRRIPAGDAMLYLLPDGSILTTKSDRDGLPITIAADDDQGFRLLLSGVPTPTWWEINQDKFIDRCVKAGLVVALLLVLFFSRTH